jgi:kynurenine 3-monooxygenase
MSDDTPVTIVGAGLAGTLLACALGRAGRRVELYEKRPDPRFHGQEAGRSINLALSVRGLHALREIGVAEDVIKSSFLMRGRMIHGRDASLAFQRYGKDDSEALHSVSRAGLNLMLVEAAGRYPSVRMHFDHRCTGLAVETGELDFQSGGEAVHVTTDFILGADGAYSAVRAAMQRQEQFDYSQDYLSHGYKELTIPPGAGGTFRMEPHALHIWPRGSFMMIALPNTDRSFTCTLFWPFEGPHGFAALTTEADVLAYFRDQFPDAVPLIPDLGPAFLANPTGSLVTIRCRPWHVGGRVALVGDACHAVVPFLGQGMNAAFEDCTVLIQCLERHRDRAAALTEYERLRREHTDALADMCIDNFIEMRDRVGSPVFRLRKKVAVLLHATFPRWYLPLYTMIEFTRIPYADARRRARRQDWIVRTIAAAVAAVVLGLVWWLVR